VSQIGAGQANGNFFAVVFERLPKMLLNVEKWNASQPLSSYTMSDGG
jgi:hypothetical protein